ncbi:SpaA isopeptide-forming pilin-related protein [Bifidobacterium biavatii]|uniref:SpaA isopeptide-forming pilin-related protein n=1 Tax=Bifidobacterium biavatii TaxID=762212 RepID=UPI000529FDCB|nr:SpaA isopeptide-forming pilin-related protein [Bifidobacterium biavatii]
MNSGIFDRVNTDTQNSFFTGAFQQKGGSITVNDGTFSNNTGVRGSVISNAVAGGNEKSSITINGGTFDNNKTTFAGGVIMQNDGAGTTTIDGGTFSNNTSGSKGGVIHNNGTLNISAGTFTGNKALGAGGGAISQDGGSTIIVPDEDAEDGKILFSQNGQTYSEDVLSKCNTTTGDVDGCHGGTGNGGGAINASAGLVRIQGNVIFNGNYSNAWGYMLGGGAIYMKGELWIQNDSKGNKPRFESNYAGVRQRETNTDGSVKTTLRGGAGGAIFLQEGSVSTNADGSKNYTSKAYIMGGEFVNNTSGYLGGAVYTESKSVTYIAKAVATGNVAGHFGGGLWLCPSGTGAASKGGNIALFGNKVDKFIDPNQGNETIANTDNRQPYNGRAMISWDNGADDNDRRHGTVQGDGTEAGADFAIMNPMWKGEIESTNFQLMDTWFTDRTKSVVDWYEDGTPIKSASGFQDYFQDPTATTNSSIWHHNDGGGTNLAVTMTGDRFVDGRTGTKMSMGADHTHVINLTRKLKASNDSEITTGVALTAVKAAGMTDAQWESAKQGALNTASVLFTGNAARLSGGAFATNGDVSFSTPYTTSWGKVDGSGKELSGSQWDLTTAKTTVNAADVVSTAATEEKAMIAAVKKSGVSGPYNVDYYPTLCKATYADDKTIAAYDAGYTSGRCWKPTFEGYQSKSGTDPVTGEPTVTVSFTSVTLSAIIIDNTGKGGTYVGFDNNPDGGGFDLNNLAPGTYTVTERVAPTGYELNTNEYRFVITSGQAKWQKLDADGNPSGDFTETDINIPDKALPGVSWGKVDADTAEKLPYSEWTVTKYQSDGATLDTKSRWTVQDCVKVKDKDIDCAHAENGGEYLADHSNDAGKFNISGLQPGKYLLQETVIPNGYWNPEDGDRYEFTIPANAQETVKLTKVDAQAEVTDIANKLPQIAWKKVAKDSGAVIVSGKSSWTITGPEAVIVQGDVETDATAEADSVTAAVVDCQSLSGSTDPCSGHATGLQTQTDKSGNAVSYSYNDLNNNLGQLKVSGLQRPTSEQADRGIVFRYVLTETAAPEGYMKSTQQYVFTIGATESTSSLNMGATCSAEAGGTNCIPNVRMVAALPFTGGWDDRDWLWFGDAFVAAAALVLALSNEYRRRKAVIA